MLCLRCCRCCWVFSALFLVSWFCGRNLWDIFQKMHKTNEEERNRLKVHNQNTVKVFRHKRKPHTHTNRNTFVSVSMAWHLIESFNVMIGHRQHVNGFSIIFIEGNSVDDRTANWDYLGRMIGMGNRSVCDEIGRWNGNLNSEHRWI